MNRTIGAITKHTDILPENDPANTKSQNMKAIRIHEYGGPEILHYEDAPRPKPAAAEVLIRVHAAGINPIDWQVREGHLKDVFPHSFPVVPGWDVSGVVDEVVRFRDGFHKKSGVTARARGR